MTDLANLVLAVDATQVKTGTASLDGLAAAGARAEAATIGLGGGMKGAGVQAAAMAAGAQASARAAMDQASGFTAAAGAARLNTIAMRETLVVARELSRGNFTRIPGSLTLLAANVQGGVAGFLSALRIIKQVQNAELAETAASTASAAAAVEAAAQRAGANILAADTEVALAEAQIRVAAGSAEEAAAQARLSAAHVAVAAAADEAAIAENALAVAAGRASEASAASAAATRTTLGPTGAVLIGVAAAATTVVLGFEAIKQSVSDSGVLKDYAETLGLTSKKFDELKQKTNDFALTWGDVWHGVKKAAEDALDQTSAWQNFKQGNESAFKSALDRAVNFAAFMQGHISAAYETIVDQWKNFPAVIGDVFVQAVNLAIGAINNLVKHGTDVLNTFIATANKIPGVHIGNVAAPEIGMMSNPNAGAASHLGNTSQQFSALAAKNTAAAKAQIEKNLSTIYGDIIGAAEDRIKKAGGNPPKAKKPKTEPVDHAFDTIAQLDAQILAAKEKLAGTAEEQAAFAIQQIDVEKNKTIADAASKLAQGKITVSENQQIDVLANQLAELKKQEVLRKEQTTLLTQQQAMIDQQFGFQEDALKTADQLATTQADHRRLQLEMLGIEFKQKEADLQILLAKQKIAGDLAGQALTQGKLDQLPTAFGQAQSLVLRNTQSPLEAWAQQVPHDAAMINEALQSIEVKGLDSLAQSITDVITGTKNLGQAFADISKQIVGDILQMIIKMLLFRALSSVFGGLFGGGSVPDLFGSNLAAIGPSTTAGLVGANGLVISGGNVIPFASGGIFNSPTLFPMSGGRTGLMGEAGPEAVMPLTRDSRGRLGVKAANDAQRGPIEIKIGFGDAPAFAPYVEQVAGAAAGQAVRISVDHTNKTMKAIGRPRITGGR